ncbi:MAG: hypothetical protein Tsb002_00340 [Wenzhouxiangellaceae bacterium]
MTSQQHTTVTELALPADIAAAQAAASRALIGKEGVRFEPLDAHSNFNYLYYAQVDGKRYYLKASLSAPRKLEMNLPRERVFMEAEAARLYGEWSDGLIDTPRILNVDRESYSFLMSDIGAGKNNLADILERQYTIYANAIPRMAEAIGRCHRGSRGQRYAELESYDAALREFIYSKLIDPGIKQLAGHKAEPALATLKQTRECLIHSDLWAKNMLIDEHGRMALVDYEGAIVGDPAFDLATMIAAGLMPVYQYGISLASWWQGAEHLLSAYQTGLADKDWAARILQRLPGALAVMLAARAAGPIPYVMEDSERTQLKALCLELLGSTALDVQLLPDLVARHAPQHLSHYATTTQSNAALSADRGV